MHFRLVICFLLSLFSGALSAQSGNDAYQFLNIPASVSAAGVGGNSVSSMVNDLNMAFHNPAILSTEMDKDFAVGYMHYVADINIGSMAFARKINDRSAWMAGIRYVDYGAMLWTTPENEILGNTYAQDMALTGGYSWKMSEKLRAGGNVSLIYSALDEYKSAAFAVDLGLYYNDPSHFFSGGLVIKSLGAQVVSYDQTYEDLPLDVQIGVSKKLAHAPFRFTLTAQNLLNYNLPYLKGAVSSKDDFTSTIFKHLVGGIEFIPSENFLLSFGYNYRRKTELSIDQRNPFGGFSTGLSMRVKKLRVGASFAKYHLSGSSLQMTLGMNMANFGL